MKIITLKGEVEVITGLHIGGGDDTMKIGGIDNQVVKDINSDNPYIPGSSIKGKMRSLLEWDIGVVGIGNGDPFGSKLIDNAIFNDTNRKTTAQNLIKIFGDSNPKSDGSYGVTRISVSDCSLIENENENFKTTEAKYENVIDRRTGTVTGAGARQTERVAVGVKFAYNIKLKIIEENKDNEKAFKNMIVRGLELIENDYLGGNGSRGYGRVAFSNKNDWE